MSRLQALAADEIAARLETLPGWRLQEGAIKRTFRTHGWKGSLMVTSAIGHLAEVAWHHPEIALSWNRVEVSLSTHDVDGISDRDFELARKIEEFVSWRPANEGGALEGTPAEDRFAYIAYD